MTNVVFLFADDMPEDGFTRHVMPRLFNYFDTKGVIFNKAYSITPWCEPTRASIYTGLMIHNHGFYRGGNTMLEEVWYGQNKEADTIATRAKAAGARTGLFGKYFNNLRYGQVPKGWDRFVPVVRYGNNAETYDYYVNGEKKVENVADRGDTELIFDQAIDFIQTSKQRGQKFLAYIAPNAPHGPATATPANSGDFDGVNLPKGPSYNLDGDKEKIAREKYEAMLEECRDIDAEIGRLLDVMPADTVFIFASDNGYLYGEHGDTEKNKPWEESVAIPFAMSAPVLSVPARTDRLVGHIDIPVTIVDMLDGDVTGFEGRNLLDYNSEGWRNYLLIENLHDEWYEVTNGTWTYWEGFRGTHLYNMAEDRYQIHNEAGTGLEIEVILRDKLYQLKKASGVGVIEAEM